MDDDLNESRTFPGPMVRVRGRVSRRGAVTWALALRTYRGRENKDHEIRVASNLAGGQATTVKGDPYVVEILDYEGTVLVSRHVHVNFFAKDQESATFSIRMPYDDNGEQLRLRLGERVLSTTKVPTTTSTPKVFSTYIGAHTRRNIR